MMPLPAMLTLIDTASETVRQSLISFVENNFDGNSIDLSADLVSTMTRALDESFKEAGREALRAFLEQFDCLDEVIERDGPMGGPSVSKTPPSQNRS